MNRIVINDWVHHVSSGDAERSCDDGADRTAMQDQGWAPAPVLCSTRWEHVTCRECIKKKRAADRVEAELRPYKDCRATYVVSREDWDKEIIDAARKGLSEQRREAMRLRTEAVAKQLQDLPLPACTATAINFSMPKTTGNFTTMRKEDWIGDPGDAVIEAGPRPTEPEAPGRTEGDDLLDFFKGGAK